MLLSDEIEQRWHRLPPISIAWIKRLKELGVSVDALCEPELPAQAQVVVMHDGFVFDFADEADGQPVDAMIFLARDEPGRSVGRSRLGTEAQSHGELVGQCSAARHGRAIRPAPRR